MEEITNIEVPPEVNEDQELDKILEDSINTVKAGNELSIKKEEAKVDGAKEEIPKSPKSEDTSNPQTVDAPKDDEYDYRIPNKGKFESDESFEKRVELMDLVKKRKLAKTDEQKQKLSEEIKTAKGQLKNLSGSDKFINPLNTKSETDLGEPTVEDETLKADRERLKQLGGATREDIEQILQTERKAIEVKSTLEKFIERHSELGDEDTREVFFDFVDSNFNWENKSGKELMTVLELARESMFKPSETIQERVLKGANVQEKVNAMQFPGGTIAKSEHSPEIRKSIDELVATGLSEEKALELISE